MLFGASLPNHSDPFRNCTTKAVLVSGPLGSGKTTLLNHLLRTQDRSHPGSFVVIENDVGGQNIDQNRLSASPEETLALTAGCICCNDLHALKGALQQLSSQRDLRTIFIETTGIANPASVKDLLHDFNIPALTIVTVDVRHFDLNQRLGRNKDTIPHADIIALTWRENEQGEVDRRDVERVKDQVLSINPNARCVEIDRNGAPVDPLQDPQDLSCSAPTSFKLPASAQLEEVYVLNSNPGQSANIHRMFTLTFPVASDATFDQLKALVDSVVPDGIVRAKGRVGKVEFDCTHGDWRTKPHESRPHESRPHDHCGASSHITLIHSHILKLADFESVKKQDEEFSVDLSDPAVLASAVDLVQNLILTIPTDVVQNHRLVTETVAGEAWRYVALPGFPADLKDQFLQGLLAFYRRGYDALQSGELGDHPALPYYQREVGYNLSWFLIDCTEELARWGVLEEVSKLRPVTLYFNGLQSASDARHIGSFKKTDIPYLRGRLDILATELGIVEDGSQFTMNLAGGAIANCIRLSLDGSWRMASDVLTEYLRDRRQLSAEDVGVQG